MASLFVRMGTDDRHDRPFPLLPCPLLTLHDLMVYELQDFYDAEHIISDVLAAFAESATSRGSPACVPGAARAGRIADASAGAGFAVLGLEPERRNSGAMEAILRAAQDVVREAESDDARDAAMVAGMRKAEHHVIAGYGTAATFAAMLDLDDVAGLLQESFDEEEDTEQELLEFAAEAIDPMVED
jgi:ferritin-like metal-binding protein YciE